MIKIPPHNEQAEKAILGSILLENNLLYVALGKIDKNAFYFDINRKLFETCILLNKQYSTFDLITLLNILEKDGKQEGLKAYIVSLYEYVCTTAHFEDYLKIVIENKKLRDLLDLSYQIQNNCENKVESNLIISKIQNQIQNDCENTEIFSSSHISQFALDNFDKKETFLKTGINPIDEIFQGINNCALLTIAGITGQGKTTLALNIAEHHLRQGKNILIFQLEMEILDMLNKMVSDKIKIPTYKLKNKYLNEDEKTKFFVELGKFSEFNLNICDKGIITIEEIIAIIQYQHKKEALDFIIIDYLQLIKTEKGRTRAEEIGKITSSLKSLARDLKTRIILISQLSREVSKQKRQPILADLKESSSIEQDSDIVIFTHFEDATMHHKIIISKNRHGECGSTDIYFDMPFSKFK
jgi:replicative DNA helicase